MSQLVNNRVTSRAAIAAKIMKLSPGMTVSPMVAEKKLMQDKTTVMTRQQKVFINE